MIISGACKRSFRTKPHVFGMLLQPWKVKKAFSAMIFFWQKSLIICSLRQVIDFRREHTYRTHSNQCPVPKRLLCDNIHTELIPFNAPCQKVPQFLFVILFTL